MPDFVHLHTHSDFSLLDGAASIEDLVARAKACGMKALALTDHGNMFGSLRFYKECLKEGIKPIIGCEAYVAPDSRHTRTGGEKGARYHHLGLLARDVTGYRNLLKLCSLAYTEGFYYKPRIDDELLARYHEGLVALSGCMGGEIPSLILRGETEKARARAGYLRELFGPDGLLPGGAQPRHPRAGHDQPGAGRDLPFHRHPPGRRQRRALRHARGRRRPGHPAVHRDEQEGERGPAPEVRLPRVLLQERGGDAAGPPRACRRPWPTPCASPRPAAWRSPCPGRCSRTTRCRKATPWPATWRRWPTGAWNDAIRRPPRRSASAWTTSWKSSPPWATPATS